jgi:hypothetical protein
MKQLILHIGMPKTGTSSIQESLHRGLSDPAFQYIGLEGANGNSAMVTLFRTAPEDYFIHRLMGRSIRQVAHHRMELLDNLDERLARIDASVRPILSAEYCWGMERTEFERVRDFMADRGYTVRIIAYVRPWKQWLESNFQQRIKTELSSFQILPVNNAKIDYRERVETLETVFDADLVQVFKYDHGIFPEGCVVRHFCQQVGIHLDSKRIRRANDSLTLPAVQLLYAYRKFGPGYGTGAAAVAENGWLNQRLREVQGPTLRLHSSTVAPVISRLLPQVHWLEQRLGVPFGEDLTRDDSGVCIRTESDLFDFDPAALAWLTAAVHGKPTHPATGEEAARAVATQMHTLRKLRPSTPARVRVRRLMRTFGQQLGHWRAWPR